MSRMSELHEKIHVFDNSRELLNYKLRFGNVPMWLLVRLTIILECIDKHEGYCVENYVEKSKKQGNVVFGFTLKNPFISRPTDVLFAGFSDSLMTKHEGELLYNDMTKAYMDIYKNSRIIIANANERNPNYAYSDWKSDYCISWLAASLVKHKKKAAEEDVKIAKAFIRYIKAEFPIEIDGRTLQQIYNIIISASECLPFYAAVWKQCFKICRPKLVVQHCASYMDFNNLAIKLACRDLNIPTAEIQHAWEDKNSHAHYWGKAVVENADCKKLFPDYFLMSGQYWFDAVSLPSKKVIIGTYKKYRINVKRKNENVLICLAGNYKYYMDLIEWLIDNTSMDAKIFLRLHPLENNAKVRALFKKYISNGDITFANEKTLEHYLGNCTYVVTCGSTVVFDALTCGNIVFVPKDVSYEIYNLDTISDKIYSFTSLDELGEIWNRRSEISMRAYDDFYDMNYKALYRRFIESLIGKRLSKRNR